MIDGHQNLAAGFERLLQRMTEHARVSQAAYAVMPSFLGSLTPSFALTEQQLLRRLGGVSGAARRISVELHSVGGFRRLIEQIERAEQIFKLESMGANWVDLQNRIDPTMLLAFDTAAGILSDKRLAIYQSTDSPGVVAALGHLRLLSDDLAGMTDDEMDPLLRHQLRTRVQELIDGLEMSEWIGPDLLESSLKESIGFMALQEMAPTRPLADPPTTRDLWERFKGGLSLTADALQVAFAMGALMSGATSQAPAPELRVVPAVIVIEHNDAHEMEIVDAEIVEPEP